MDSPITLNSILIILSTIVGITAGIGAIILIIKWITGIHDRVQRWDEHDAKLQEARTAMQDYQTSIDAKLQEIRSDQYMLTYCMQAVLSGLIQQGCNGPVTKAKEELDQHLNKSAHEVN